MSGKAFWTPSAMTACSLPIEILNPASRTVNVTEHGDLLHRIKCSRFAEHEQLVVCLSLIVALSAQLFFSCTSWILKLPI